MGEAGQLFIYEHKHIQRSAQYDHVQWAQSDVVLMRPLSILRQALSGFPISSPVSNLSVLPVLLRNGNAAEPLLMDINAAIVVSDLHCGSSVGLAHPETEMESGNVVSFGTNYHQEWLWETWLHYIEQAGNILEGANIALIVNGDATEGIHHRSPEVIQTTIAEHCSLAEKCLQPYKEMAQAIFVTKGTECHTLGMEDELAKRLGAVGEKAANKHLIDINGSLIDVAHHMVTTSRVYLEASGMGITMGNAKLNSSIAGHRVPDIYLRGHRHTGGVYTQRGSAIAVTGGWQFLTRHGNKVVTDSIPMPTVVLMDWRNPRKGEMPMFTELFRKPPQPEITTA